MSDHYPCLVSYIFVNHAKGNGDEVTLEKRKLNEDAMLKIQKDLLFYNWSVIANMSVDESYAYLISVITDVMNVHAPKKCVKIRIDDQFREPWLTVKLKKYNQKCRKLCNKARRTQSESDHRYYRSYRNTLNRLKEFEKRCHYKEVLNKIGKNTKLLWNVINGMLKKSHNKSEIVELKYGSTLLKKTE